MKDRKKAAPLTAWEVLRPLLIGGVMFLGTLAWGNGFSPADQEQKWRALTDAFTVPGVLLTGAGLLSVVSGHGAFRGVSFGVKKAFGQVLPEERRNRMPKNYLEYSEQQARKPRKSPWMLLAAGGLFLAGAGLCLWVYLTAA